MHILCPAPGEGWQLNLAETFKLLFIQKLPLKCWRPELGQILHNCCSEVRLVTKYCKFNRQLFEARNMTDLLTVSENNHLLLEMVFTQILVNIKVWTFQMCIIIRAQLKQCFFVFFSFCRTNSSQKLYLLCVS